MNSIVRKRIDWQDVIDLDAKMSPSTRSEVVSALDKIESSKAGQRLLSDLHKAQAAIPSHINYAKVIEGLDLTTSEKTDFSRLNSLRSSPIKLMIHAEREVAGATLSPISIHIKNRGESAAYIIDFHFLHLNLTSMENAKSSPFVDKAGKRFLSNAPLDESLFHELQHAIDFPNVHRKGSTISRACAEEIAVRAEGIYRQEKNPNNPRRYAYNDPELQLKAQLQEVREKHPDILIAMSDKSDTTPQTIRNRIISLNNVLQAIDLGSGCKPSNSDVSTMVRKASEILNRNGVATNGIEIEYGSDNSIAIRAKPQANPTKPSLRQ